MSGNRTYDDELVPDHVAPERSFLCSSASFSIVMPLLTEFCALPPPLGAEIARHFLIALQGGEPAQVRSKRSFAITPLWSLCPFVAIPFGTFLPAGKRTPIVGCVW